MGGQLLSLHYMLLLASYFISKHRYRMIALIDKNEGSCTPQLLQKSSLPTCNGWDSGQGSLAKAPQIQDGKEENFNPSNLMDLRPRI